MADAHDHWDAAQEGAERIAEGDLPGAVAVLTSLVEEDPRNEYAFFFLGAALYDQQEYARALKAYVSARDLVPKYLGAIPGAGHCLRLLGHYREAIRMGHEILKQADDDPDALHLLGASHFAMGDNAAAAKYLERFLQTTPEIEVATEVEGMLQVIRGEVVDLDDDSPKS